MKNQPTPTSYEEARDILRGHESRKIAGNTYLERLDAETIGVRLHRTYVVKFYADPAHMRINSGGWRTVTTKDRINRYLPAGFYVRQEAYVWYVEGPDGRTEFEDGHWIAPAMIEVTA